ncbi:MAG: hypothetical protein ACYTXA_33825 [Nostoc sp.]
MRVVAFLPLELLLIASIWRSLVAVHWGIFLVPVYCFVTSDAEGGKLRTSYPSPNPRQQISGKSSQHSTAA